MTNDARSELVDRMVSGGASQEIAQQVVDGLDDAQVAAATESFRKTDAERDALRDRLRVQPLLSRAVCPGRDWKTPEARYQVAAKAVRIVDAHADKAKVTAEEFAQALIDGQGTVADTIALHGDDPRTVQWGKDFYAFRWRCHDAYGVVTAEETERIRREREATRDAAWGARGLVRCDRCGGAGGASQWPGFTCYDCGGQGAVTPKARQSR